MSTALAAFLEFVEWERVLAALAQQAQSTAGAVRCRGLVPSLQVAEVRRLQRRTAEAIEALEQAPDMARLADLSAPFGREEPFLDRRELYGIASTIELGRDARAALQKAPALLELAPAGDREADDLALAATILSKIGPHGVIYDSASEALAGIRHELGAARAALDEALRRLCADPHLGAALADRTPASFRGQRCLKVRASEVRRIPGPIVHQQGPTLLVEPDAAREHYNRIRHLQVDERNEEQRVCAQLSALAWPRGDALTALSAGLTELDVHLALARQAGEQRLVAPELTEDGLGIELGRLRHPLLLEEGACVPIDLALDGVRTVVVSGPNGGGKTVGMKAVGIAAALAQVGSHVPAEVARLPIFAGFQAAGEPQASLEEGVSTFQAHAQDLALAVDAADGRSLTLLDEIGTGTDPGEAAALAQAVLEHLLERGGLTLTTTHLAPLKGFAEKTPAVANAAVGLDGRGQPTFELVVGAVGRSYALDMARTKGLLDSICDRAQELHSGEGQ